MWTAAAGRLRCLLGVEQGWPGHAADRGVRLRQRRAVAHLRGEAGGSVACWGSNRYGQGTPSAGEFASVSAGTGHTCGMRRDGSVACWGDNEAGQATPSAGEFASVSAGWTQTCGLRQGGPVAC